MYDVIVIGGGLAGCASAILLSELGHKVLLIERGGYPVHKVCGEFLSVETCPMLERLGVLDQINSQGASRIDKLLVTSASGKIWRASLSGTALGFSRYRLDKILFDRAVTAGAATLAGTSALEVRGSLASGFHVSTSGGDFEAKLVVAATGKKPLFGKREPVSPSSSGGFVAFKEHYTGPCLNGSVEVHAFERGYCGINQIEEGEINVCWMARRSLLKDNGGKQLAVRERVLLSNPALMARLSELTSVSGSFCALGGISLKSKGLIVDDICHVGDAAQMIAPFCGDGMGMALRSSEIAVSAISDFLFGKVSTYSFIQNYTESWKREFRDRIIIGKAVQYAALSPIAASFALNALNAVPQLGAALIGATRGAPDNLRCQTPTGSLRW
jgi:flavin-dependent dehydrogenase